MASIEQIPVNPHDVVMDTCILMDLLFAHRPAHLQAKRLAEVLNASQCTVFLPAHSYFELVSAMACQKRHSLNTPVLVGKREELLPFHTVVVSIDLQFVEDYLIWAAREGHVIDLKGGDMIFVALALRQKIALLSEDEKLRKAARKHDVAAFGIDEYLSRLLPAASVQTP